jgi:hypothetical protein
MAKVEITVPGERIVDEFTALVPQPTTPATARPVSIGLVEISQSNPTTLVPGPPGPPGPRGSQWTTGTGAPSSTTGNILGDMYLDNADGTVWTWNGTSWVHTATDLTGPQGSPDTAAQVLAKLVTVDGAGSGLDADLLDGHDTPYFATQTDMTAVQATNTAQDTSISNINSGQTTQDNRLTAIEAKNTSQDTAINLRITDAPSDGNTYARSNAAWVIGGGSGGGGYNFEMVYNSGGEPPASGQIRFNTSALPSVATMWMSETTAPGNDAAMALAYIGKKGTKCFIQDKNDSTKWCEVKLTSDSTDKGTYKEWTVDVLGNGIALTNNQRVMCYFTAAGGASVVISDTAPSSPTPGNLWFESDTGNTYIYYADADSSQWVQQNVVGANTSTNLFGFTRPTVNGSFLWNAKSDNTGANIATLDNAGGLTASGNICASGGSFFGTNAVALATGLGVAGTVYLRPNGFGTATGQVSVDSSGILTSSGGVTTPGAVVCGAGNAFQVPTFSSTGATDGKNLFGTVLQSSRVGTAAANHAQFFNANGAVGQIQTSASTTAYQTTSDENLKDFIGTYDPLKAIDIIRRDPVRDFTWKQTGEYAVGWGAQTSYAISPDLAGPPEPPEEGKTAPAPGEAGYQPWGMDQSRRTPYLWAALAWALDKIDDMEARLAALEAR